MTQTNMMNIIVNESIQISLMLPWIDGFITASENEPGLSYWLFNERA
jgi:hypothetical protein